MALKFLNKKGWHTGSLRNIETVWKAEQKHEGEQKKLEELRKQIQDEREKSEFRHMQEQAGLVPKQERLEFLYDSGLQVGKVAQADEYLLGKPVEEAVQPESDVGQVAAKPGALFVEEKPASANDSWRKLHSDPLFMIRQQEQAAIAKIKSNPVKMAEIRKAAEMKKKLKEEKKKKRKEAKRERREKKKRKKLRSSSSEDSSDSDNPRKDRKHGHLSDADDDAGHKDKRTQVLSRNLSRIPSRSPTRSPVQKDRRESPRKFRSLSRSPARRKDYGQNRSKRDVLDSRGALKSEGRHREHNFSDQRFKESEHQDSRPHDSKEQDTRLKSSNNVFADEDRRKQVSSRNLSRSPTRSPTRSLVRRDRRQSPRNLRSLSRSPTRRRDFGQNRSRRDDLDSMGALKSEGRHREFNFSDQRLKESDHQDYGKRKRAPSRSLSRSPVGRSRSPIRRSRSPVRRRDYGQSRLRRDDLDSRGPFMIEGRHREHNFSDLRMKESDHQDPRPYDTREQEGRLRYSSNGSADDLRRTDPVMREKRLGAEDEGVERKEMNGPTVGVPSRPMNKGRPPKPGQLSDAERAARLAEMQANADVHEEQRWQRLKRAADADAREEKRSEKDKTNEEFLADTQKSIFGSEKASASTIEKSVKRRAHFIERSSADIEKNAFRR